MPYQPTNPYPYNTAIDLDEGLEFRFKADNYDVINSFEIELYDLLKNKKLYTINRCIGDIQDNKIIKGTKQLLQIFDENEEQIYLNEFSDSESSILPLKSKRNNLNLGVLNLSGYLATIEQIEKRKYYSEVDNAEHLTLTKAEAFKVDENGVVISYNSSVLSEEEKKKIIVPYELPFTKQEVTQKIKVTGIADNVFAKDKNIEEVIIPSCVVFVGESNQADQKEILGAFYQAENLKRVVLNYGTSKIGKDCFWGCTNLTDFNFIDSISEIGENVFRECKKLLVVNCPTDLKIIPRSAFENSGVTNLFLSKNTQRIEARAFKGCGNLTQLKTYPQLELIGDSSFKDTGLKEVELAEGLKHCDGAAFSGCPFTTIVLPTSLESLGVVTFAGCDNLEELTTPLWSTDPFYLLFSGKEGEVPNSLKRVTIIETEEIADEGFKNLKNIQEINIAEGLKRIGEKCFMGCNQLIKFVCPSTLETIGASAFAFEKENSSTEGNVPKADLFTIDFSKIDSSHTFSIGQNAFQNRENIKEIVLPSFTSEIGIGAFYNCFKSSLEEVILKMPLLKSESVENEKTRGFKRYFVNTEDANLTPLFPQNLKKITISQVVGNQIEDKAFCFSETEFLSSIENIELPDSVTKIGEKAFYNIKFSTFSMPFNIVDIGQNAFNFSEDCDFYWTTLLTYDDAFIRNNNRQTIFGNKITTCKGNKGVVVTTKDGQTTKSIYKIQGGATPEEYNSNTHKILYNKNIVADFSGALCFFGVDNVAEVSGACGDYLTYQIQGDTLNIMGYGDMWNFKEGTAPWYGNRANITKIKLPSLTSIGDYAFYQLSSSSVNWEDLTQSFVIGAHAFDGTALITLSLPSTAIELKEQAFANNHLLITIAIPSTVNIVGKSVFFNSEKVVNISTPVFPNLSNLGDLWGNGWTPTVEMNENLAKSSYDLKFNCYGVPISLKEVEIISGTMPEDFLTVMSNTWLFNGISGTYSGRIMYEWYSDEKVKMDDKILLYENEFDSYLPKVKYESVKIRKAVSLKNRSFCYCYMDKLIIEDINSLNTVASGYSQDLSGKAKTITQLFANFRGDYTDFGGTYERGSRHDFYYAPLRKINFKEIKLGGNKTWDGELLGFSGARYDADSNRESGLVSDSCCFPHFAENGLLDLSETNLTSQDIKNLYYVPSNATTGYGLFCDYWIMTFLATYEPISNYNYALNSSSGSHQDLIIGEIKLPSTCKKIIPYMFDVFIGVKKISGNQFDVEVPSYGLYGLSNLESINFINFSANQLYENAFTNCKNLSIDYYVDSKEIPNNIFKNCAKMRIHFFNFNLSKIKKVGEYAFCGCKNFTGRDYYGKNLLEANPEVSLGKWCFANSGLTNLNTSVLTFSNDLPEGVFWGCENLLSGYTQKKVVLQEGVTSIADYSLGDCNITDIEFPTTMSYIGENSLYGYKGNSISLPFVGNSRSNMSRRGYTHNYEDAGSCAFIFGFLYTYDNDTWGQWAKPYLPTRLCSGGVDSIGEKTDSPSKFVPTLISYTQMNNLIDKSVRTPTFTVWSSNDSNYKYAYVLIWPDNLTTIYINNYDEQHQLHDGFSYWSGGKSYEVPADNGLNPCAFYGAKNIKHTYFKVKPTSIGTGAYTNAGTSAPELWTGARKIQKKLLKNIALQSLEENNKNNILYINREKEYYWDLKLFGDKYDVYITDNNTFADKNSYLPSIYAANHDGVEEKQHITIEGENTYEISNIDYFKSVGKTYYRQSKGIMSGPISYYGVANGTLTYNSKTDKYTVDEELRKVMSTDKVKFSMGSKYTSETYAGTICLKDGEVVVELQEATAHSQFEFGAAIALQYTIVTQASLSENLLNVVKAKKGNGVGEEGTKFTVSSDNTKQEVTAINDYFNITFTPGFKNSTSGYTSVQMTLADKDEALILPNSLTTKQVLIVVNTKGKIRIDGKKDDEIKRGTIDESLLSLIVPQETEFTLEGKTYIVRTKDKQNNSITFSTEQNKGYIVDNEQEKSLEIQLTKKYIDIASTTFDKTNLVLTLNYINTYTVDKIEKYPYSVPIDNGEKLYLVTCEEVVNPTNFEVNERSLEKEATLERQSMILTVKTTDGTALPHLLVEGDSYYDIYSNYIKSPAYYFRTLQKKPLDILYNKKVVEETVTINSASATFSGYCENNISYYEWELYEYYIDDYILVDKFTNKYTTNLFYDCHKLVNNTNYELKLKVITVEGLKIEKSININVQYADDLSLKNAFVERDCLRQAIAIDLTNARFKYKGVTYSVCPFSKELKIGVYGPVKGFYVIRTIKDEPLSATVIGFVKGFTSRFYDYSFQREETYEYSIIPVFNPVNANGEVETEDLIRGVAYKIKPSIRFNTQTICLIGTKTDFAEENEELQELTNCYLVDDGEFGRWYFKLNSEDKNVTVVTDKNIYENNNPFASVNQTDRNYKTGSVTVMLGNYHKTEDKQWTYKDSIRLQNKFQAFCNNGKLKMLRDEIGNVIPVDVTLKSFDYLPQAIPTIISVTFEWTQVGSEENLGVYDYRKENELDKICVLPFDTREEVLSKPLEVQGLYFEKGKKIVPSKDIALSGQGVEYNESTGFVFLNNKAPKTEIVVTVGIKSDESIKTTFTIPAID